MGKDEAQGRKYRTALTAEDIDGYYENTVALTPLVPSDDTQKMTMGLRLVESGVLSPDTFLDKFVSTPLPADELEQAQLFKILQSPEVFPIPCGAVVAQALPGQLVAVGAGGTETIAGGQGVGDGAYDAGWELDGGAAHQGRWSGCRWMDRCNQCNHMA